MRITKYLHSCLLIEHEGMTYLMDPGMFSCQDAVLDIKMLPKLDYIFYTHSHSDHFMLPCLKELMNGHEYVQVVSNESLVEELRKKDIDATTETPEGTDMFFAAHEKVHESLAETPENVGYHMFDLLTNPGDSFKLDYTNDILVLPIQAPWGATTRALELADRLQPKYIIPVHDWHWKEEARHTFFERMQSYFSKKNIEFIIPETGKAFEINA